MHRSPHENGRLWWREELESFLEIFTLSSFAVAQPVLDVLGRSPETFAFRSATPFTIVLLGLVLVLGPPVVLWSVAAATRLLGPRVRGLVQGVAMFGLILALALSVARRTTSVRGPLMLGMGALAAAGGLILVVRSRVLRRWLRFAWPAGPAFLALFLFVAPIAGLIRPPEATAVPRGGARTPVVMVLLDQFPLETLLDGSGGINEELFPGFAQLARGSTWYRNYTVIEPHTQYSIPTILTGREVRDRSKTAIAADHPDNLFTLLRGTHRLNVVEPVTQLCPDAGCRTRAARTRNIRRGGLFRLLGDAVATWWAQVSSSDATTDPTTQFAEEDVEPGAGRRGGPPGQRGAFRALLRELRPSDRPALHYLHLMLPHVPWRYFPSGSSYERLAGNRDDLPLRHGREPWSWVRDDWAATYGRQRHLLQAMYVDGLVSDLIRRMRATELYDDALVIVTSDHGISLQEGRSRGPTPENMHEIYWVPMFVKYPGQDRGAVDPRNVLALDLLPTIADVVGVEVPWRTSGRSFRDPGPARGAQKTIVRRPEDRIPWPKETLRITIEQAEERLRAEAFSPAGTSADPSWWPFLVGPRPDLVGDLVASVQAGPPASSRAILDVPTSFRDDGGPLPALFWGRLAPPRGALVVVAVNGTIAGVSTTWVQDGVPGRFGIIAPERLFRPGQNRVELFLFERGTLHPVPLAPR